MALKSIQDAMLLNKPSLHLDRIGERHLPAPAPAEEALAASLVAEVSALSAQVAVLLRAASARKPANFRRCASPPDKVGTGWPSTAA